METIDEAASMLGNGAKFGDYTVVKLLGKGGMGAVYLMKDAEGSLVAVKIMLPDKMTNEFRRRFMREAEFSMKVRHKNLISVHRVGEDPETGWCYLVMDYVAGGSLADRLKANGRFSINGAVSVMTQIAAGLDVAHRHGLVHRDIKPDNILFDADGTPRLADLGVAKFEESQQSMVTTTGMVIGTPAYMAPEQMLNSHKIDARADIYAMGVVLYEMLTGKRPNEGSTAVELMAKAIKGVSLPDIRTMRPELSAAIAYVLSLLCAPRPNDRPQTALAAADILCKAASDTLVLPKNALRVVTEEERTRWKRRRKIALAALFVIGLASLLTLGVIGWGKVLKNKSTSPLYTVVTNTPTKAQTSAVSEKPQTLQPNIQSRPITNTVTKTDGNHSKKTDGNQPKKKKIHSFDWRLRYAKVGSFRWYYTLEDGEAIIWRARQGYYKGTLPAVEPSTAEHLVVPAELDGHKVTKIGHLAFFNCKNMKSISIPEGVRELQSDCFHNCDELKAVALPSTLERVEEWAFYDCKSLETLDMGICTNFLGTSFGNCPHLSRVSVSKMNSAFIEIDGALYTRDKESLVFYPRTVHAVTFPRFVKRIGRGAFQFTPNISQITVPSHITEILDNAFYGCDKLVSVNMENGVRYVGVGVFRGCDGLKQITFPASLRELGDYVFQGCKNLERITFRGDAPIINEPRKNVLLMTPYYLVIAVRRGSKGWESPNSAELPTRWPVMNGDLTYSRPIGFEDSQGNVRFTDANTRTTKVGEHTWYYKIEKGEAVLCNTFGKKAVKLPAVEPSTDEHFAVPSELGGHKVAVVGESAFVGCKNMKSISIPEGVRELRYLCFDECSSLKSIKMPATLESIEDFAFADCHALEELDVGQCRGFTGSSFGLCSRLSRIVVPKTNPAYVEIDGVIYTKDKKTLVFCPRTAKSIVIPDFVQKIGDGAFNSSTNLTHVTIPGNVTDIGTYAFAHCHELRTVDIGNGVRHIGTCAFSHCHELSTVDIGNGVRRIDDYAFSCRNNLKHVVIPASIEEIGYLIFDGCNNLEMVTFNGDAPIIKKPDEGYVLGEVQTNLVIAVKRGTKGWKAPGSTELPERWPATDSSESRPIRFVDTP